LYAASGSYRPNCVWGNRLQTAIAMSTLPIKAYIRTRPTTDFAGENIILHDDRQTVTVQFSKSDPDAFLQTPDINYTFKLHSILHNVSQEIVFEECAREIVDSFIQGYHGCILAYGQRGAGKTFTMFGGIRHFKYRGVIPRAISYVFQELEKFKTIEFHLRVHFFQIHQDIIYDLLADDAKDMQLAEDEYGVPFVQNLTTHEVTDLSAAIQLLNDGDSKLHLNEHKFGRAVHRSHVVFGMDLVGRKSTRMTRSKILMIDLGATEEAGDAAFINKSMAYLQQLVVALNNRDNRLPFRRSKMTYLLRDAIGGNCRTAAIANVWPEKAYNRETLSTLKFADSLGKVGNDARVNILEPPELRIEKLEGELRILEAENELQNELAGQIKIDGLTRDEEGQVSEMVQQFLADEIDMVRLLSIAHIKAIFAEIKRRYADIPNQVLREVGQAFTLVERVKNPKAPKDVGQIDGTGFSIGVAPSQDRPANIRSSLKSDRAVVGVSVRPDNPPVPTKDQMFEIYKVRDGKALASELSQGKRETKALVELKQKTVASINETQELVERLGRLIAEQKLRQKDQLLEQEAQFLKDEIAAKQKYRELYQSLQKTQCEIDALKEKCATIRTSLLSSFEEWHKKWERDELYTEKVLPPHTEADQSGNKESAKSKKPPPAKPVRGKPAGRGRK
jgi:kinesin family protein 6/9